MRITFLLILICIGLHSTAQTQPLDSAEMVRKVALYSDDLRAGNLDGAKAPLEWLLANAPQYDLSIYIHAEQLYSGLLKYEQHPDSVVSMQHKMIATMNSRVRHFGNRKAVLKRKAYWMYSFWKSEPTKYSQLLATIDSAIALNEGYVPGNLLIAKMDIVRRMKIRGEVSDWDLLMTYDQLLETLNAQPADGNIRTKSVLDEILVKYVNLNCEELGDWIMPKWAHSPGDTTLAYQVLKVGLAMGCTNTEYYLSAVHTLFDHKPTLGLVKFLAARYHQMKRYQKAEEMYLKGLELEITEQDRSELYMLLAINSREAGNLLSSRKYVQSALETGLNNKMAYEFIGDLYLSSYEECKEGANQVEDRSVFWLAYDYYEKSGNNQKMEQAEQQFPSIEDIFNQGLKESDQYTVSCWFIERTRIRRRPPVSDL